MGYCIGLRPILSDCKRRNPQNLAGSAPQYPHFANHLIQKKESISRLLGIRDSGGIRTHDPQLRRLLLYPTELRNHPYMHSSQMLRKSNIFFPITLHLIDNFSHKVEYSAIWAVIHLPHSQAIHPLGNDFIE